MKRPIFALLCLTGIFFAFAASALAAPSAADIFKEAKAKISALQSFSYVVKEDDYQDQILKERVATALTAFNDEAKHVSAALGDEKNLVEEVTHEQIKSGVYGIRFVRPFMLEMVILRSGYFPDSVQFLKNATLFYRPDTDPKLIYLKSRSGIVLFQPIKEVETGAFFTLTNWLYDALEADFLLAKGGKLSFAGEEEVDGRAAWVLQFAVKDNPSLDKPFTYTEEQYGMPPLVWPRLDAELGDMKKRIRIHKQGEVKWWVDKENRQLLKKETTFGGKCIVRTAFGSIKTNHLKKEDISNYAPTGKKAGKKQ